jgi:ADP-L-glycero-D-manno-heptose 6-epimerase
LILITGAAGFIGSVIAAELNRRGRQDLILCDELDTSDKWKNLLGLHFREFVDWRKLKDKLRQDSWVQPITVVIHMGAITDTTERNAELLFEQNTRFSQKLCQACIARGMHFIYASSAAVYGDGSLGFSDADALTPRLKPLNAYGFSKWLFDQWVLENGLADKVCGLRFFNVYGPNEYHKGNMASVVYRAFPLAASEGRVRLFESHRPDVKHGEQARDFIHVEEALAVVTYMLEHPDVHGIYNVGTGRAHTFNQLAQAMFKGLGKNGKIEYFPMPEELRDRYQYHTAADMARLYATGFPPFGDHFDNYVGDYVSKYLNRSYRRYQDA